MSDPTRMHRRAFLALGAVLIACALSGPTTATAQQQTLRIGLIGDLAYAATREPLMANVLEDLERHKLDFVAHVGDLGSPRGGTCTDALLARRLAQFKASSNPLVYTPGDNEWADCHDEQGVKDGKPLERLALVRKTFFEGDTTLGKRTFPLLRQSSNPKFEKYRENVRWDMAGVTFMTLHVIGSNNNRARTAEADAEYAERTVAVLEWMRAGFAHAKASGSRAVMIIQQGNMWPNLPPFPGDPKAEPSGFTELRGALAQEAKAFAKPILLVHGDSHYYRVDKPFLLRRGAKEPAVANLTRLETFGDPFHHWVEVVMDPADANVFAVHPRLVEKNLVDPE